MSDRIEPSAPPLPSVALLVTCPHCRIFIEILELNCRIFRCGMLKENFTQIGPHLSKEACDALVQADAIYGCGKPFRIPEGASEAIPCDYI